MRKKIGLDIKLKHVNKSQPNNRQQKVLLLKKMFKTLKYPLLIKDKPVMLDKNTANWNPLVTNKINEIYTLDFELLGYEKIPVK